MFLATIELMRPDLFTTYHRQSFKACIEECTSGSISKRLVGSCPAKTSTALCNACKDAAPAVCPFCMLQCVLLLHVGYSLCGQVHSWLPGVSSK